MKCRLPDSKRTHNFINECRYWSLIQLGVLLKLEAVVGYEGVGGMACLPRRSGGPDRVLFGEHFNEVTIEVEPTTKSFYSPSW